MTGRNGLRRSANAKEKDVKSEWLLKTHRLNTSQGVKRKQGGSIII